MIELTKAFNRSASTWSSGIDRRWEHKERFFSSLTRMVTVRVIETDATRIIVLEYQSRCRNQKWWHHHNHWLHALRLRLVVVSGKRAMKVYRWFSPFEVVSSDVNSPTALVEYFHWFFQHNYHASPGFFVGTLEQALAEAFHTASINDVGLSLSAVITSVGFHFF